MKLSKRDVNLILGLLSFILLLSFIFFFYTPKNEQYKEEVASLDSTRVQFQKTKAVLQDLPTLEGNLEKYREKSAKKAAEVPTESNHLNENKLLITLEDLADRTQIDMELSKNILNPTPPVTPVASNPTGTNPDGTPITPATPEATPPADGTTTTPTDGTVTPATTPPPVAPPIEDGSYKFVLKGEYRSVMVFLFEIRNLEFPANVSNFEIKYNQKISNEKGFPLEATFTAKFEDQGGVIQ